MRWLFMFIHVVMAHNRSQGVVIKRNFLQHKDYCLRKCTTHNSRETWSTKLIRHSIIVHSVPEAWISCGIYSNRACTCICLTLVHNIFTLCIQYNTWCVGPKGTLIDVKHLFRHILIRLCKQSFATLKCVKCWSFLRVHVWYNKVQITHR